MRILNRAKRTPASALLATLSSLLFAAAFSTGTIHSATPSPTASAGQNTSTEEQLAREELQYYQNQNKKTDGAVLNWPAIVGISGALIAAVVGLLSLYVNNRTAIRNQRDGQFYEALKRFGDKDSPTVRASAAGTLSLQGQEFVYRWKKGEGQRLFRRERVFLYYQTAVDQLVTGLMLEENIVTLTAISDAAQKLVHVNPLGVLNAIHKANLKLQRDLVDALAQFFAAMGYRGDKWMEKINEAALVAGYEQVILEGLHYRYVTEFDDSFKTAVQMFQLADPFEDTGAKKQIDKESSEHSDSELAVKEVSRQQSLIGLVGEFLSNWATSSQPREGRHSSQDDTRKLVAFKEARTKLAVSASRLRANVEVYAAVLRADPFKAFYAALPDDDKKWDDVRRERMNLENAFLVGANLEDARLNRVSFEQAQLQLVRFSQAELKKTNLLGALLQGSSFLFAHLDHAKISAAQLTVFEHKSFDGTVWHRVKTDLQFADLSNASLERASLAEADLTHSNLRGAKLAFADMVGTRLFKAKFSEQTDLKGADWWHANFFDTNKGSVYVGPLEYWFEQYGDTAPSDPEKLHPSLREFARKRAQSASSAKA